MSKASEQIRNTLDRGSLYALLRSDDGPCRAQRISLTLDVQDRLREQFAQQAEALEPEDHDAYEYQPFEKLDSGQLFRVPVTLSGAADAAGFHLPPDLGIALRGGDELGEFDPRRSADRVCAVAWVLESRRLDDAIILFQTFQRTQVLSADRVLGWLRGNTCEAVDSPLITLRGESDSMLRRGALYFHQDFYVKRYLPLSDFCDEATEETTRAFFQKPVFHCANGTVIPSDDAWIRRKVNALLTREGGIDGLDPLKVKREAARFGLTVDLQRIGGKQSIVLPAVKRDLKDLLRFLDEDFFTSWMGAEFQAAGKRRVKR